MESDDNKLTLEAIHGSARCAQLGWRFWVDRGGTFTDLVGCAPDGSLHVRKLLTDAVPVGADPAVAAIRDLLKLEQPSGLPFGAIDSVRIGTTVATNALLEGDGAELLLVTNVGLADVLRIGDQHRPELFSLKQTLAPFLAGTVLEMPGRLDSQGQELEPIVCDDDLQISLRRVLASGVRHAVVAFLHASRNAMHERAAAHVLLNLGFSSVVCSHQVSAKPRLVSRGQTALVEAAVAPVLQGYLSKLRKGLMADTPLRVMTSSGALQSPDGLLAKDTILSGPAAGMVGAIAAARASGFDHVPVLGFDMGGTSTDVFCVASASESSLRQVQEQTEIAGLQLLATRLPIETVAAGGGSVLEREGDRLQVGPRSAGARPGPACYRAGGPLTITDANLLLGRLQLDRFPAVFGPHADQPPDLKVVQDQFAALAEALLRSPEQLAEGALQLTIERMADAIRRVSLHRGQDIRGGVLVAYGGAAGQHACRLADELGLPAVLLHPMAGVLSAYGMGQARQRIRRQRHLGHPLTFEFLQSLPAVVAELESDARQQLMEQGDLADSDQALSNAWIGLDLRYRSSDQTLMLSWSPDSDSRELELEFQQLHQRRFGYCAGLDQALVVEMVTLDLAAPQQFEPPVAVNVMPSLDAPKAGTAARLHQLGVGWREVPVFDRETLQPGQSVTGPALLAEATGCIVLEADWVATVDSQSALVLRRLVPSRRAQQSAAAKDQDPLQAELFRHRFMAIAEQMGERLRQSSRSVNIRERLDFSCALFDARGELVANAPHIPVHLGSMGESVRDWLAEIAAGRQRPLQDGDTVLSNDPFHGGTHLPDITAITPVFCGRPDASFFVASRGHHADIGGISPGSMPSFSRSIDEEGLLLRNVLFVRQGRLDHALFASICSQMGQPPRNSSELLADLQAQVAANQAGVTGLQRLVEREGEAVVSQQMAFLKDRAACSVRQLIQRLEPSRWQLELDDGAELLVRVDVDRDRQRLRLDFSGTSVQRPGNFNAPFAVTKAVILYVIRSLLESDIPLNEGCFTPIDIIVPLGSLLNPRPPAAVVAGNVEVSQALCNLLLGAFGVQAAGQGTMNNVTFGDRDRQYYETLAGGGGAGKGFCGSQGIQVHMTNSRLTDPEVLEARYPVRLEQFSFRSGSGGEGRWRGGDGLVRQFRFLEPMQVSVISGSRRIPPFGLQGGEPGKTGRNQVIRLNGSHESLPGCTQLNLRAGEALQLQTPGGGGFGRVV
ncbi:MAG: 5-oxoprolinase [Cyanobium sp. NAT70]|nr:5-oxoprolinase [Cyanobium sp. NAT70]